MATFNFEGVDSKHPLYEKLSAKWKRARDVCAGQDAVYAGGPTYLPKLRKEPESDYKARLNRTPFYNASWRTVSGLVGMIFNKEPQVKVPTSVEALLEDVTLTGIPFNLFAKQAMTEMTTVTFGGILVDHPPRPQTEGGEVTLAMAEQLGLRPSMVIYKAEQIWNWQHRRINNKWTKSQVRLSECVSEKDPKDPDNEFKRVNVEQIRVLDLDEARGNLYRQRIFRKSKDSGRWEQYGEEIIPVKNGKPLDYIPFEFFPDEDPEDPALIDLFDMNLKHFQVSADYEHGCHWAALPTPWVAGLGDYVDPQTGENKPRELTVGGMSAWIFPNPETTAGMLEFTGAGMTALKDNLQGKEAQMAAIGARMLAPEKKGVEAGETLAIRHAGENSVLADMAIMLSLTLTKVLGWFSEWAGASGEATCDLNRDFMAVRMDAATLTAVISGWQQGALSEEELYELLQRGDVVRSDKPFDEHQGELEANPSIGKLTSEANLDLLKNPPEDKKEE